jgi:CRP-like cAMP-binding protein
LFSTRIRAPDRRGRRSNSDVGFADLHLARGEQVVERQRQLVQRLGTSELSEIARTLLNTMESVLANMRRHRDLAAATPFQMFTRNRLLAALSPSDFRLLARALRPTLLSPGQTLARANVDIHDVVFMESGVTSVMSPSAEHPMEIGVIGREGMTGMPVVLSAGRSPFEYVAWGGGDGLAIGAETLLTVVAESGEIRRILDHYMHVFEVQTAEGAAASGLANVDRRVARWLLLWHDRCDADTLYVTHDFIAAMLGLRRATVTDCLHRLEGVHSIRSLRGQVLIRERRELEQIAGNIYGSAEGEFARLFPQRAAS